MGKLIYAPWTDEQVAALNRWQAFRYVHPFTCGNKDGETHKSVKAALKRISPWDSRDESDALLATKTGWVCPFCDYTQNWAHDFMLEPPPPKPPWDSIWERNQK